jgi:hypothetical protein
MLLYLVADATVADDSVQAASQRRGELLGQRFGHLGMLTGAVLLPLIMAYRHDDPRPYKFEQALQDTASQFVQRLTPQDARCYVAIVGAGPAGLRAAELIIALNRQVAPAERKKVLLFDRNPVLAGLGVYGIPPVKKQGVLKDGVVKQAQGVMHGLVGKREWQVFPTAQFLQVVPGRKRRVCRPMLPAILYRGAASWG